MATWQGSLEWGPEWFPTCHGPVSRPQLTAADHQRMTRALAAARRFRMPTFREEIMGLTMKLDQAVRAQTVAWL